MSSLGNCLPEKLSWGKDRILLNASSVFYFLENREEPSTIPIHNHLELYQNYSFQPKATFQNNNKRSIHAEIFQRTRNTNKGDELSQMLLMYQHFSNTGLFSSQI